MLHGKVTLEACPHKLLLRSLSLLRCRWPSSFLLLPSWLCFGRCPVAMRRPQQKPLSVRAITGPKEWPLFRHSLTEGGKKWCLCGWNWILSQTDSKLRLADGHHLLYHSEWCCFLPRHSFILPLVLIRAGKSHIGKSLVSLKSSPSSLKQVLCESLGNYN